MDNERSGIRRRRSRSKCWILCIFVKINICPSLISIKNQFNGKNANEEESKKSKKKTRMTHIYVFKSLKNIRDEIWNHRMEGEWMRMSGLKCQLNDFHVFDTQNYARTHEYISKQEILHA